MYYLTPLSDQESSRVSMTSVEEPKGAELIFCKALATDALETGIILFKPLVCADFRPHPHAHRTPARVRARAHARTLRDRP